MRRMAESSLLSSRKLLLGGGLGRRRDRPVVLPQLRRAGEGIRCYWRGCASVPCGPGLATVIPLHGLTLLLGLLQRILVGVGRIWHCNGRGCLGDWRKYLSHRDPVTTRLSRLDRDWLVGAVVRVGD